MVESAFTPSLLITKIETEHFPCLSQVKHVKDQAQVLYNSIVHKGVKPIWLPTSFDI